MFPVKGATAARPPPASAPVPRASVPRASVGATPPGRTHEFQRQLVLLRDELTTTLRDGCAIEGRMQAASLTLITQLLDAWPRDIPIRLHTTRDDSGRRYDPRGKPPERIDPVRVRHTLDERCVAFRWLDGEEYARDCGADPDSFFEAVLVGLQHRDGNEHSAFTEALRAGRAAGETDARLLRQALIDLVERAPEQAASAFERLVAAGNRSTEKARIDVTLMRELLALGKKCFLAMGLKELAAHFNISWHTLRECFTSAGEPRARGNHLLTHADRSLTVLIDAALLEELVEMGVKGVAASGGLEAVAELNQVSYPQLRRYFNPQTGRVTPKGQRMRDAAARRAERVPVAPVASTSIRGAPAQPAATAPSPQDLPEDLMDIALTDLVPLLPGWDAVPGKRARWDV